VPTVDVAAVPDPRPDRLVMLDVREPDEWAAGHVAGAVHIPLLQLPARLAQVPQSGDVLCVCRVGARSAQATAFLRAHGIAAFNLAGGMLAWQRAGRPLVSEGAAPPAVI
jgi:rhodanese-related sulfurtransferase